MKKLLFILIVLIFCSCGYYKENEIARVNTVTGEVEYVVWVFHNVEAIESYRTPLIHANQTKIDSLNKKADILISQIKKAGSLRKISLDKKYIKN